MVRLNSTQNRCFRLHFVNFTQYEMVGCFIVNLEVKMRKVPSENTDNVSLFSQGQFPWPEGFGRPISLARGVWYFLFLCL